MEMKYKIDPQTARVMSRRLGMCCTYDRNADEEGYYKVTSLYFDDFNNSYLTDNMIGQMNRKKYRIRIYNGLDSFIRLEKKIKHNQGGRKEFAVISRQDYQMIFRGDYEQLQIQTDDALVKSFCMEAIRRRLRPKVIVEYDRQTFVYNYGTVRVTLDHKVRYSATGVDLFNEHQIFAPAIGENEVVLEVKYTGYLPGHIRSLVQQSVSTRQSVSKYSLCRINNF
jgi:hypothetical protein